MFTVPDGLSRARLVLRDSLHYVRDAERVELLSRANLSDAFRGRRGHDRNGC